MAESQGNQRGLPLSKRIKKHNPIKLQTFGELTKGLLNLQEWTTTTSPSNPESNSRTNHSQVDSPHDENDIKSPPSTVKANEDVKNISGKLTQIKKRLSLQKSFEAAQIDSIEVDTDDHNKEEDKSNKTNSIKTSTKAITKSSIENKIINDDLIKNGEKNQQQLYQMLNVARQKLTNCLSELREIENLLIPTLMVSNEYDQLINDKTDLLIHFSKAIIDLLDQVTINSKTSYHHHHNGNNIMITKLQRGEYDITEKDAMNDRHDLLIKLVTNLDNYINHHNGYLNSDSSSLPSQTKPSQHLNHNGSIPLSSRNSNQQGEIVSNHSQQDFSNDINSQEETSHERIHDRRLPKQLSVDIPNDNNQMANTTTTTLSTVAVNNHEENDKMYDGNCTPSDIPEMNIDDSATISSLDNHDNHGQSPAVIPHEQLYMNGNHDNSEMGNLITEDFKDSFQRLQQHLNDTNLLSPTELDEILNQLREEWFKVVLGDNLQVSKLHQWFLKMKASSSKALSVIIDMQDLNGNTLLHHCIYNKKFELAEHLLNTELCQPDLYNQLGYTPIMVAALLEVKNDERRVIMKMLSLSDVDAKAAKTGQTALMLAAAHNKVVFSHLLIQAGTDINLQDKDGSTALMTACEHGHKDIVKLLLAQPNINVAILDNDSYDALSIAMGNNYKNCGVLIYNYISKTSKTHSN